MKEYIEKLIHKFVKSTENYFDIRFSNNLYIDEWLELQEKFFSSGKRGQKIYTQKYTELEELYENYKIELWKKHKTPARYLLLYFKINEKVNINFPEYEEKMLLKFQHEIVIDEMLRIINENGISCVTDEESIKSGILVAVRFLEKKSGTKIRKIRKGTIKCV